MHTVTRGTKAVKTPRTPTPAPASWARPEPEGWARHLERTRQDQAANLRRNRMVERIGQLAYRGLWSWDNGQAVSVAIDLYERPHTAPAWMAAALDALVRQEAEEWEAEGLERRAAESAATDALCRGLDPADTWEAQELARASAWPGHDA